MVFTRTCPFRVGGKPTGLLKATELYRQLQLLEGAWNYLCKNSVQMLYLMASSTIFTIAVYSSIKFVNEIPLTALLVLASLYINCAACIVVGCTTAANVHKYSHELLHSWKVKCVISPIVRKRLIACTPLKIKLGTNYIDKLTPFVIMDFTISQTFSALLIK
jgi:hypothetical protein